MHKQALIHRNSLPGVKKKLHSYTKKIKLLVVYIDIIAIFIYFATFCDLYSFWRRAIHCVRSLYKGRGDSYCRNIDIARPDLGNQPRLQL